MGLPPSVEVLTLPLVQQRLPLEDVLRVLGERGANEILVEAGATLAGALITAGLVDEIVYYQAAKLLGASARPLVEMHYDALAEVPEFTFKHCQLIGDDVRLTLVPKAKEAHETYVYRHY
jgi:diaminohydroxyphosphoribosylaminopyrimidine deaminase/5-amino-6-(5-phosphoribosylamino)uracil reductase